MHGASLGSIHLPCRDIALRLHLCAQVTVELVGKTEMSELRHLHV